MNTEIIRKSASADKRNLVIVDILLSSGIRVSELVGLNRSSIDLNSRTDEIEALFITSRKKGVTGTYTRLTVNSVEKMIRGIGEKTKIEKVHPHRFRRTMATRAIDKGMPIEQVQVLLGHTKIDTTLRYANVQQSNVRYSHQKYVC